MSASVFLRIDQISERLKRNTALHRASGAPHMAGTKHVKDRADGLVVVRAESQPPCNSAGADLGPREQETRLFHPGLVS